MSESFSINVEGPSGETRTYVLKAKTITFRGRQHVIQYFDRVGNTAGTTSADYTIHETPHYNIGEDTLTLIAQALVLGLGYSPEGAAQATAQLARTILNLPNAKTSQLANKIKTSLEP